MNNVAKVIQDKISQEVRGKTMYCTVVEGPLNCLAVNKDCSQLVAAGRNVFKVFSIEDDEFVEKANLRVGRNLNLNFSASDVVWNPVEDHLLASAATNGAVVTWNLNRSSRSKQDQVFQEHRRTVNRVTFHSNEHHLLMSGAQDGFMKLFDLRQKRVSSTFSGQSESVRDVQFSPHQYFVFAAAYENGNVQIWDMRNPSRWEKQFPAHGEPVFSIDWHPDERNWIATAGRDKMIKVWDMTNPARTKNSHSVQTIASVARIKWRPERRYHIASCALLLDFSINVWDIRRPFIPFAAFNEHKDVVTGIVWKQKDPHMFFSSSKDCTVYQHMFRDATRPADSANPVGMDIKLDGTLAHAYSDKLVNNTNKGGRSYSQTRLPSFFRKGPDKTEQFTMVTSLLTEYDVECDESLTMEWFTTSARSYQLSGKPIRELCDHNAQIAMNLGRHQVAQTWCILKLLYDASGPETASIKPTSTKSSQALGGKAEALRDIDGERIKSSLGGKVAEKKTDSDTKDKLKGDVSTGISDEESDLQESEQDPAGILTTIASGVGNTSHSDFFFGDGDVDYGVYDYDSLSNIRNGQDWDLPNEAFEPRFELQERSNEQDALSQNHTVDSPSSTNENEYTSSVHTHSIAGDIGGIKQILCAKPFISQLPEWQCTNIVCDMLYYYAEQADVQMAVSVLIVLGDKLRPHVEEITLEHWFMSYVDLLTKFQLWTVANEIIKLSNVSAVSAMNQLSTLFHTCCGKCSKPLQRVGWLCDRCKNTINLCSVCHLPVKGLYAWCQGCAHGGHLEHMREWLRHYKDCPAGCGHMCEFT